VIRVEGLRKSFGDVRAVDGVDLHVERGELLVLLGQNGAGKSTTLRCLGGILRPDAGLIELDGLRLPEKLDEVRARLGVVPDQARLYGRNTAPEYLDRFGYLYGVPEQERRTRIAQLLERFDLADRTDTVLAAYSRGMAQKVALIRATLHNPDWIFCDEPTAGLDPVAAADMRRYLGEQRSRGAALIVTTHVLSEAELMADRIAIMREGVIVTHGKLEDLRQEATKGRRLSAQLSRPPADPVPLRRWLAEHAVEHHLVEDHLTYTLPWQATVADRAAFAAALQRRLSDQGAPFHELEEEQTSLESVYLKAMAEPLASPAAEAAPPPKSISGIGAPRMFASLRSQGSLLRHSLPFYVSSWWRRGDLSWVMYLNAFVLLLVAGTSLFGQLPGVAGQVAQRFAGGTALQAGLLLPLFFMSFALLESIKSSIGIWWEKAQQSLEVLLYTPIDDPSLIWLEVLPGAVVSTVWVTFWMARHDAPHALRPAGSMGSASDLRVRGRGHRLLGRDGADARVHALPARGCGRRSVVVLALACVRRRGRPAPGSFRVSLSAGAPFIAASDHGVLRVDRPLWHDLRPRAPHGDRPWEDARPAGVAARRAAAPQRRGHCSRPPACSGSGRDRGDGVVERTLAFVV
jgi:ABC-type multidrug transport system, ATPase component